MKRNGIHQLTIGLCFISLPVVVSAQFNKFKTPTKYDLSKDKPQNSQNAQNSQDSKDTQDANETAEKNSGAVLDLVNQGSAKPTTPPKVQVKSVGNSKAQDPRLNTNDSDDYFGRGTGIKNVKNAKKDTKYVNLNPETAFGPEIIESFEFPNTSLVDLTKHMQKLTGINLILDKDLKGKVSIMAPTPITVGDAWRAYLTALNLNSYTLVKSGAFYKIVSARDIRYTPTKIYTGNFTPDTENYAMRIIPLKNIDSTEVTRSFRPFMSRYGRIIDLKQTNTIIVQDTGDNIKRLIKLIRFVDIPGHEESLQIIKVKNSSAQEIAKLLTEILKGKSSGRFKSKVAASSKGEEDISRIIAEPRTNTIIAMANADGAKQLRGLIKKLDVKIASSGSGQIHVYYLNYGDAEALSKTLASLVSSASSSASKSKTSRFSSSSSSSSSLFNEEVKITADKDNNALVVTAAPTDYLTIKSVIKKLDIPRDQVFVEGLIMETNVNKTEEVGINIVGAYGSGNLQRAGFVPRPASATSLFANNPLSIGGFFAGGGAGSKITQTVGGQEVQINSVNALINALARDTNSNVLATPQVLALDNTEASFEVGETVPTAERTDSPSGTSSTSIKQQKVALSIKLTPQINKVTRFIKLKINQKIEDFSDRPLPTGVANQGVGTTLRSTDTTVVVRDKDTIAMGGLMRDKVSHSIDKVPLLGDIPILGWLFKSKSERTEKVNLLMFLTPRILASYQKTTAATVKDVINRRSVHLKDVIGEKDPFGSTAKGLFDKATKQAQGPLYDKEEASKYKKANEAGGLNSENELEDVERTDEDLEEFEIDDSFSKNESGKGKKLEFEIPNYKAIAKNLKVKKK